MPNRMNRSYWSWYESLVGIRSYAERILFAFHATKTLEWRPNAIVANINLRRSWASCRTEIELPPLPNESNSYDKKKWGMLQESLIYCPGEIFMATEAFLDIYFPRPP